MSGATWTWIMIKSWSRKCFETFETIRNDSTARPLGAVQVKTDRLWTAFCHAWTAALAAEKEVFFLYDIVTGNEKCTHNDNPKRKRLRRRPGDTSTSVAKPKIEIAVFTRHSPGQLSLVPIDGTCRAEQPFHSY